MLLQFEPGDALVLVSDGFFEWANASGENFGTDRLRDSILASCREAPEQVIERLRRDVTAFHGGTSQADDTTALNIRCVS
jgi:serine phosphatase RsbU (regulator of sigma subunit)